MGRAASGNLRPWVGSAIVHGLVVAALALAAVQWRTDPPPPQLAIEGNVVRYEDLPSSVKAGKAMREPTPVVPVKQAPAPAPKPEPPNRSREAQAGPGRARAEGRGSKRKPRPQPRPRRRRRPSAAARNRRRPRQRRRRRRPRSPQSSGPRQTRNASRTRRARQEAAAAKQQQAEQEAGCAREQRCRLRSRPNCVVHSEDEEAGEALARSGVVDEYRTLLIQTIERNWNRPPSARAGLECTLYVTQATGGTVLDVKIGACNGDQAVRESVANAVYRSSPLPAPRDARAFERRLVIVFKPTE